MAAKGWYAQHLKELENFESRKEVTAYLKSGEKAIRNEGRFRDEVSAANAADILDEMSLRVSGYLMRDGVETRHKIALVDVMPDLLANIERQFRTERIDLAIFMFWDSVVSMPGAPRGVKAALFASLTRQLFSSAEVLQTSALHGLGHLEDKRCRPLLRQFIRLHRGERVAQYAEHACNFKVL